MKIYVDTVYEIIAAYWQVILHIVTVCGHWYLLIKDVYRFVDNSRSLGQDKAI